MGTLGLREVTWLVPNLRIWKWQSSPGFQPPTLFTMLSPRKQPLYSLQIISCRQEFKATSTRSWDQRTTPPSLLPTPKGMQMGDFVSLTAHLGVPGVNPPTYNEQLCEAKDLCVVTEKNSSVLHLVLSFGPIILSSPLCIALGNRYGTEGMPKSFNRKASHCQKKVTVKQQPRNNKTLLSFSLCGGSSTI